MALALLSLRCALPTFATKSPLRLTFLPSSQAAFTSFGFPSSSLSLVPSQTTPDPDFPTVKFPNPEELGALTLAIAHADSISSTLVLANDPDADRFTAAEKQSDGTWHQFTGDELGALMGSWACQRYKNGGGVASRESAKGAAMCASTVSSKFLRAMGEKEGFLFRETLTGFKCV